MRLSVAPVGSVAFLVHSAASCSPGASSPSPPLSCNGVTRAVACQMQTGGGGRPWCDSAYAVVDA